MKHQSQGSNLSLKHRLFFLPFPASEPQVYWCTLLLSLHSFFWEPVPFLCMAPGRSEEKAYLRFQKKKALALRLQETTKGSISKDRWSQLLEDALCEMDTCIFGCEFQHQEQAVSFFFFWQGGLGFLEEEERSREGKLPKAHSVQNKYHGFKSHNCRSHYWVVLFRSRSLKVEDVLPVPPDLIFNELLNWSLEKNQNKLPNSWLAGDPQSSF